jgi:2-methylisocitrate lyase-like PEP mutase family enzyme
VRPTIRDRAETLQRLHRGTRPLVLPTVWDPWSARLAARAGFAAFTIGSMPLALARGAEDEEGQSLDEMLAAVAAITAAVELPVSVDLESGYGRVPAELTERLLGAGGVGLNVEDTGSRSSSTAAPTCSSPPARTGPRRSTTGWRACGCSSPPAPTASTRSASRTTTR